MKKRTTTPLTLTCLGRMAIGFFTILTGVCAVVALVAGLGLGFKAIAPLIDNPNAYLAFHMTAMLTAPPFVVGLNFIFWAVSNLAAIAFLALFAFYLWLRLSPLCLKIGDAVLAKLTPKKEGTSC